MIRPPGRNAAQAAASTRVLEVGEVVLAGVAGVRRSSLPDLDAIGQTLRFDRRSRTRDRVRLEFDADELELREPASHRDEPATPAAMHIHHPAATRQVGGELRQRREDLLEEH